ncbi:MAG: hypothetical protein A2X35_02155 [Elusimicrobia bacterium GWA2_61_42]|nr:MAG: hypothetical protein A2X35_02155 [Elusimicrobia bacterium GWA2_61_42]OGR79858.1 MAG: hypothetical protein A2X38_12170 [Elusimicrobia bacterium GWC2_61_25]
MSMKLNITRILSLSVLLLLPAFAAAGQRKAVRKAALPKLVSDGAAFRAFNKPAAGAGSTTTQDGGEASGAEVNRAQSTGGAGVSVGVGIVQNPGGVQNTGASGTGAAGGSGGFSTAGSGGFSRGPASASALDAQACAWISETSPTPSLFPSLPCSSANEGAVSHNSQNQGNFTCICDHSENPSAASNPVNLEPVSFSGASESLCSMYGLMTNIVLPRGGNTSIRLPITAMQGYSFAFKTGPVGEKGAAKTNYLDAQQYMSLSKNTCDYDQELVAKKCAKGQTNNDGPHIYYKVGGTSPYECILEPNTVYYINIRNAIRKSNTREFIDTCPGMCSFMLF